MVELPECDDEAIELECDDDDDDDDDDDGGNDEDSSGSEMPPLQKHWSCVFSCARDDLQLLPSGCLVVSLMW
jgi:hypothetical protein